jgi:hypothetical protein
MNTIHSPIGDSSDAADELPSIPLAAALAGYCLAVLVACGLAAAFVYGLGMMVRS